MLSENFYLAASAVIPITAIGQAVQRTIVLRPSSEDAELGLKRLIGIARIGNAVWTFAECVLFVWAEYVCLGRLETGRSPYGDRWLVWTALLYGAAYWTLLRMAALVEEDDVHALVAWFDRKGTLLALAARRRSQADPPARD